MNIPTQFGQGPAASSDYQSLYAAPSGKSTFAQTLAQAQSASLSLTTAEGDLVTLSDLSLSYQYTQGVGWFTPASSGVKLAGSSTSAEAMGLSVQGDLSAQELADITRLVTELTDIASAFFSGDYEEAMTQAMDFGDLGLGSVSSLAASFSSQTVTRTRLSSHHPLPAMADLQDISAALGTTPAGAPDYGVLLEARWQQILKTLEEMEAEELDGLFARQAEPQPVAAQALPAVAGEEPPAVLREAEAPKPAVPAEERAARKILVHLERFLGDHPKLTPFAGPLAATAMEKAASRPTEQPLPDPARAYAALDNAFRNRLDQWFLPPAPPTAPNPGPTV